MGRLQICPNDASTLPPNQTSARTWEGGGRGLGLPENGVSSGPPSLASMAHGPPRYSVPRLLNLLILTLSPSDPLSRWASSGQQPQQQHIPTRALPSSKQPWHCLVLLSWRQTMPAPGFRLVNRRTQGLLTRGACSRKAVNGFVWFFVLLFSRYS